jgi:hypothetical protein
MQRQVVGGNVVFPFARAREVLTFYADYSVEAPDDLYLDCFVSGPPGGGDPVAGFGVCYSGPPAGADRALGPLRRLGTPLADTIKPIEYVALQRSTDVSDPRAMGAYLKNGFTAEIAPKLITAILDGFERHPGRATDVYFQHSGGAIGRVPTEAAAFAHRYSRHNMMVSIAWPARDPAAAYIGWARKYWATLEPFTRGIYVNHEGDAASEANPTYLSHYPRLVAIKKKYDPTNLFRLNANIDPTA